MTTEAERARFEAWAKTQGYELTKKALEDNYFYPTARVAWRAWQAAKATQPQDKGPWRIVNGTLQSDDFNYDVMLKVDGDFGNGAKQVYLEWLCGVLNGAKATQWQPIEKSPKDGTHITLSNGHDLPATCHWFDGGWHLSMNRYGPFSEWTWRPPTHWQPLPAVPPPGGE